MVWTHSGCSSQRSRAAETGRQGFWPTLKLDKPRQFRTAPESLNEGVCPKREAAPRQGVGRLSSPAAWWGLGTRVRQGHLSCETVHRRSGCDGADWPEKVMNERLARLPQRDLRCGKART